jgi:hypothetical protein
MNLQRTARDYYVVSIETAPALSGTWQASFDRGATWHDGILADDQWSWLVAGPLFDAASVGMDDAPTVATLVEKTTVLLRIKDDPVLSVQRAPERITLWGR